MSSRFSRLISHAKQFGFISSKFVNNAEKYKVAAQGLNVLKQKSETENLIFEYGPYGSLLRKNILEEWWKSTVTLQEQVFPLSVVNNQIEVDSGDCKQIEIPRERAFSNFLDYSKIVSENEFGIAQVSVLPSDLKKQFEALSFPFNEYLTLHYICPEKKGTHVFNRLAKQRLRWWKKFANKQANFQQHVTEREYKDDQLKTTSKIEYGFSFGKETVETISLGESNNGAINSGLNFIECSTSIEKALLTYLDDSLEWRTNDDEDDSDSTSSVVLRLHPSLSPIKAILSAENSDCEQQRDLVERLSKELKIAGITCQIMSNRGQNTIYKHADAIGTPFCFTIDARTLQRGIVSVRHRDTSIQEFMHISEVRETLSKILKFV